MANLREILRKLDPQTMTDLFLIRHDISRRRYPVGNIKVSGYEEFVSRITNFYQYQYRNVVGGNELMPEEMAWPQAKEILESAFGNLRGAVAIAKTGLENGIEACFDKIYEHLRKEQVNSFFEYVLTTDIEPLNFEQIMDLMSQLRHRFSASIPEDYNVMSAAEMAIDYKGFIRLYVERLTQVRLRVAG